MLSWTFWCSFKHNGLAVLWQTLKLKVKKNQISACFQGKIVRHIQTISMNSILWGCSISQHSIQMQPALNYAHFNVIHYNPTPFQSQLRSFILYLVSHFCIPPLSKKWKGEAGSQHTCTTAILMQILSVHK